MVTTNDPELAGRLRRFRNHGIDSDARQRQSKGQWHYEMIDLGYNYRLTDIGCALGLSQLNRLDQNISRRCEISSMYSAEFEEMTSIIPPAKRSYVSPAWHLYPIRLDLKSLNSTRSEIFAALRAENIGVNVHYIPVHLHPYYSNRFGYGGGEYPVAEAAYESLISLPMFQGMTDQDVLDVVKAVSKVLGRYAK